MDPARQALPSPQSSVLSPPFRELWFFDTLDSTQIRARAEVQSGRPMHGIVLWAGSQTAGHGRTGRAWSSEPGGLYVTACLPEGKIATELVGWLPIMAAIACADEIESRFGLHPQIKWPNDVLIENRKVAGVIGDAMPSPHGEVYLIGMGLNWSNPAPNVNIPTAALQDFVISLGPLCPLGPFSPAPQGSTTTGRDFLIAWLDRLGRAYRAIVENGEAAAEELRQNAEVRLWRRGQSVRFERTEFGPVEGILIGLGPGGSAVIEQPGGPPKPVYCGNAAAKG